MLIQDCWFSGMHIHIKSDDLSIGVEPFMEIWGCGIEKALNEKNVVEATIIIVSVYLSINSLVRDMSSGFKGRGRGPFVCTGSEPIVICQMQIISPRGRMSLGITYRRTKPVFGQVDDKIKVAMEKSLGELSLDRSVFELHTQGVELSFTSGSQDPRSRVDGLILTSVARCNVSPFVLLRSGRELPFQHNRDMYTYRLAKSGYRSAREVKSTSRL